MNRPDDQAPPAPLPCANNCGFYGSEATKNLCSQCYSDLIKRSYPSLAASSSNGASATRSTSAPAAAATDSLKVNENDQDKEFSTNQASVKSMTVVSPCSVPVVNPVESVADTAANSADSAVDPLPSVHALDFPNHAQETTEYSVPTTTAPIVSANTNAALAVKPQKAGRCAQCNKKTGLLGFECKCGYSFCSSHRYPSDHLCLFDFRQLAQEHLSKTNQRVIASKLARI